MGNGSPITDHRPPSTLFQHTALLGLGLMGGSLGLAMRERGLTARLTGYARKPETRESALSLGIVDEVFERTEDAVRGADLVVLGTPLLSYEALLRDALPALSPGCIVTDLGSTKAEVVETCEGLLEGSGIAFVGGHPMTGSEESGPGAARPRLYENAPWCLTPTGRTPPEALQKVRQLAEAVGSQVVTLSPKDHDLAVAASSHAPHLVAVALVRALEDVSREAPAALQLTAGGFRDTTRVASGSPEMWRDICLSNRDGILHALESLKNTIASLEQAIALKDEERLLEILRHAKSFRDDLLKKE